MLTAVVSCLYFYRVALLVLDRIPSRRLLAKTPGWPSLGADGIPSYFQIYGVQHDGRQILGRVGQATAG